MPRTKSTATLAACNGCKCCSRNPKDHTCPIATKVPPQTVSKQGFFKPIKTAQKEKTPTARQIASAPVYKPGEVVTLPRGAKPSTDADFMRIFAPELCGGPPLSYEERRWVVLQVADATWREHSFAGIGVMDAIQAFKACKIVVNPWDFDWFAGFVNSRAAGMKRKAAGKLKGVETNKKKAREQFDEEDFDGMSDTHKAHYNRLAQRIAWGVADRDKKERPSMSEIWKNTHYSVWKSSFALLMLSTRLVDFHTGTTGSTSRTARGTPTPAPAACGSSAVDTAACASWSGSSTGRAARTRASCPTPPPASSATRRAARARTPRRRRSTSTTRRTRGATPARSGSAASRSWAAARTTRRRGASRWCARRP